jgi:hypothetical protein
MGIFLQFYTKPHVCGESHGQKKKRERNFYHLWLTLNSNATMVLQT